MRTVIMLPLAALTLAFASCGDNANKDGENNQDSTVTTTSTTSEVSSGDTYANVPQPARTNFESRYPQANRVKWTRYEPNDAVPSDWTAQLDTSDYAVSFNWDGMDYIAWYDDSTWIGSSTRLTDHSKLPKAVNDAIHSGYSGYTITEVDKQNDKDRTIYEVDLEKGSDKLKVHFDENGKVVKMKGRVDGEKVKAKEDTK